MAVPENLNESLGKAWPYRKALIKVQGRHGRTRKL
jgi:hypothetical protein